MNPSCPTRRSSDLKGAAAGRADEASSCADGSAPVRLGGDGGGLCPLHDAERGCRLVLLDPADPLHLREAEAVALHEPASGATPILLCSACHSTAVQAISLMFGGRNSRTGPTRAPAWCTTGSAPGTSERMSLAVLG